MGSLDTFTQKCFAAPGRHIWDCRCRLRAPPKGDPSFWGHDMLRFWKFMLRVVLMVIPVVDVMIVYYMSVFESYALKSPFFFPFDPWILSLPFTRFTWDWGLSFYQNLNLDHNEYHPTIPNLNNRIKQHLSEYGGGFSLEESGVLDRFHCARCCVAADLTALSSSSCSSCLLSLPSFRFAFLSFILSGLCSFFTRARPLLSFLWSVLLFFPLPLPLFAIPPLLLSLLLFTVFSAVPSCLSFHNGCLKLKFKWLFFICWEASQKAFFTPMQRSVSFFQIDFPKCSKIFKILQNFPKFSKFFKIFNIFPNGSGFIT